MERAIDLLSNELGMDPAELRLKNFIRPDQFPYQSAAGSNYDVGDYSLALEVLLERSDYKGLRELQARRVADKDPILLGLGLSTYVEVTNPFPSGEFARVEILKDAKAIVYTGTSPHGQGHDTSWSMIVCETLGIAMEDIEVVHGDTDRVARGVGTFGSRSLQVGGSAVLNASEEIADKARELAASLLEADPADVVFDVAVGGAYIIGTKTKAVTWAKLYEASSTKGIDLFAEVDFNPDGSTYPFGAHLAVVEVDSETGKVSILRMIAVDDAGRLLNPLLAEGQVQGGLGQGIAQALLEEVAYDEY
ncbi:Aldehyde oxidase and xanthine dehydrogenase, molybdopterin binding domain protein, partial [mine drainage metagenome]